jgi:hypothetical protein
MCALIAMPGNNGSKTINIRIPPEDAQKWIEIKIWYKSKGFSISAKAREFLENYFEKHQHLDFEENDLSDTAPLDNSGSME